MEALKDEDGDVRGGAADALASIGPAAKDAAPALVRALKDPDSYVRWYAADAVWRIGRAAVPALV